MPKGAAFCGCSGRAAARAKSPATFRLLQARKRMVRPDQDLHPCCQMAVPDAVSLHRRRLPAARQLGIAGASLLQPLAEADGSSRSVADPCAAACRSAAIPSSDRPSPPRSSAGCPGAYGSGAALTIQAFILAFVSRGSRMACMAASCQQGSLKACPVPSGCIWSIGFGYGCA